MSTRHLLLYCFVLVITYSVKPLEGKKKSWTDTGYSGRYSTPQPNEYFKGVYPIPVRPVEEKVCSSVGANTLIERKIPVVLKGCTFATSALKWNTNYLLHHLRDSGHPVLISSSRSFPYYDTEKISGKYRLWSPPVELRLATLQQFMGIAREMERTNNGSHAYFQSLLYLNNDVSRQMHEDVMSFNYTWLMEMVTRMDWRQEMSNLLLIGMKSVVTPAHYDLLENFYLQIQGKKRWLLFSPDSYPQLYPYPADHPHNRQSQVNFDDPDYSRFPQFKSLHGQEVVLASGDVLYIPVHWWHFVETSTDRTSISLNFWFEPNKPSPILTSSTKYRRNYP